MRALIGLLATMTALAGGVAAQPARHGIDRAEAAKAPAPQAKGKPVQGPTKGKRIKTTIPPRKGKKG